jgi:hypothetical protein
MNVTGGSDGLARTLSFGIENGIPYLGMRFAGTTIAGGQIIIAALNAGDTVAAAAEAWSVSSYLKLEAGSLANLASCALGCSFYQADGTTLTNNVNGPDLKGSIDGTMRRYTLDNNVAAASTARVQGRNLRIVTGAAGTVTDFTIRLYLPQVEKGAFSTSAIPTTGAAATRAIDLPTSAFAHDAAVPITIYAKATPRGVVGVTAVIASLDDGTSNNRHTVYNSAASARAQITITGGVTQANLSGGTPVIGTSQKSAMSAKLDDVGFAQAGTAATRDTSSNTMPPGLTTLRIGHAAAGTTPFNGHIEEIRIFRHDNTNTQLVALTA